MVVAGMALASAACGGSDKPAGARALDVGYAYGYDVGDVGDHLAFAKLEDEGITIRTRDMGGTSEAVVGLGRGDIDIAQVTYAQLLAAISAGAPIKAVLGQNMTSEIVLVGGPGVDSLGDLRGKRAAASTPGGVGDMTIRAALDKGGLSEDEVDVVYIDESTTRAPALAVGRIDAAALDYVDYELLRRRDDSEFTLLARADGLLPSIPLLVWAVDETWAQENDDLLRDTVAKLLDGYETVYSAEGRKAWLAEARRSFLHGKDVSAAPDLYEFYRAARLWPERSTLVTEEQHNSAVTALLAAGAVEQRVAFGDVWSPGYWADAAR